MGGRAPLVEAKEESERAQLEAERAARKEMKKGRKRNPNDDIKDEPAAEESDSSGDEPLVKRRGPRTPASSVDRGSSQPRGPGSRDSQGAASGGKQSGLGVLQRHLRD